MVAFNFAACAASDSARLACVRRFQRVEKIEIRHLGVHDDERGRRADCTIRSGRFSPAWRLLAEIAMRAHARRLDHAPQGFLAPTPARLVRFEHHAELQRFAAASDWLCWASVSSCFFTSPKRGRLRGLALLQALLISPPVAA